MLEPKSKIGILGGTFDPIHVGHLILAQNALEKFELDKILVLPTGKPPHKLMKKGRAETAQRLRMTEIAVSGHKRFDISLLEMNREGYSYTYDTLEELTKSNPEVEFYFLMGVDALMQLESWKNPEIVCRNCTIIVAMRDRVSDQILDSKIEYLSQTFHAKILKLDNPNFDISSRMIREKVRNGLSIQYFVPDAVLDFIKKENLYKDSDS
jgi:nicotinate-nucleotide adenylyltransferase